MPKNSKSFLQRRMIRIIEEQTSLESIKSTFAKFAHTVKSETERESFLAMYKAVTIIFTKPINLEFKVKRYDALNRKCIRTLRNYEHLDENLVIYRKIIEFNREYVSGVRNISFSA